MEGDEQNLHLCEEWCDKSEINVNVLKRKREKDIGEEISKRRKREKVESSREELDYEKEDISTLEIRGFQN